MAEVKKDKKGNVIGAILEDSSDDDGNDWIMAFDSDYLARSQDEIPLCKECDLGPKSDCLEVPVDLGNTCQQPSLELSCELGHLHNCKCSDDQFICGIANNEISLMLDTGAPVHVCSKHLASEYAIVPRAHKQRGLFSVQGQPIQRYGQKTVCVDMGDKISSSSTFEVTDSRKEILAAAPIVDKGVRVVLDGEYSYMLTRRLER